MTKFFPILEWLPKYNKTLFKGDLAAGLTVGVMLIPQGMAYAMLAGLPPIYGLYASIFPLIIYAIFGTTRQLAVGPVAMDSLLVAAGVGALAVAGTEEYIALAILLAFMVGILLLVMGIFRLGFLVNFLSRPIISGFTSAAALIIASSQLKHLFGLNLERTTYLHETLIEVGKNIGQTNLITLGIGITGIVILKLIKNYKPSFPSQLVVVVLGILTVWALGLHDKGVKIVSEVPQGLPSFGIPEITLENIQALIPIAITIALIAFMEAISVGKAIQAKHKNFEIDPNQELIALGLANIVGSLFKSFNVTGGFSRSAVNDQAGAKTGLAGVISAGLIVLTLLFLTPLFYYLPTAVLASIIIVAVLGLINIRMVKYLWLTDRTDFAMLLATFLGTLFLGMQWGVLVGIGLSLLVLLIKTTRPHYAVMGKIPNEPHYKNISRFPELEIAEDTLIIRFDGGLYFANVGYFKDVIKKHIKEKGDHLKAFFLDADSINNIDSSAVYVLEEIVDECRSRGIKFYIISVKGPVRDVLGKTKLMDKIGRNHFFMQTEHAMNFYRSETDDQFKKYAIQITEE
ncbi:MAG: SulP family sulfate permease [Cognaticolwellia sp.]|jgi:SulP family sulfate permease